MATKRLSKSEKAAVKSEAIDSLKNTLKEGDTIYTVLRHVSRDGMSRQIDVYVIRNNEPRYLSYWTAKALDYRQAKNGAAQVGGCGMDMGFHLVDSLSYALFKKPYALQQRWL